MMPNDDFPITIRQAIQACDQGRLELAQRQIAAGRRGASGVFDPDLVRYRHLALKLPLRRRREPPALLGHIADQDAPQPPPPFASRPPAKRRHATLGLQERVLHEVGSVTLGFQSRPKSFIGQEQEIITDRRKRPPQGLAVTMPRRIDPRLQPAERAESDNEAS